MIFRWGCVLLIGLVQAGCSASTSSCELAAYLNTPASDKAIPIAHASFGGSSVAQAFMLEADGTATTATVLLKRTGDFTLNTQTLLATIEGNGSGGPDNTALATSEALDPAFISSNSASFYTFTFSTAVPLTASTIYWLRVRGSYPVNSTQYVSWSAFDGLAGGYSVNSTSLHSVYETGTGSSLFSSSRIGGNRFLIFTIGC